MEMPKAQFTRGMPYDLTASRAPVLLSAEEVTYICGPITLMIPQYDAIAGELRMLRKRVMESQLAAEQREAEKPVPYNVLSKPSSLIGFR